MVVDSRDSLEEQYVPSSSEVKLILLGYAFVGLLVLVSKRELTRFQEYHVSQALGWWMLFFVLVLASVVLLFVPVLRLIPLVMFLLMVMAWGRMVYVASQKSYEKGAQYTKLFHAIGQRCLSLMT